MSCRMYCPIPVNWDFEDILRMQVAWGGYLSDEDTWLSNYYLYKSIYHLHYSDCAGY